MYTPHTYGGLLNQCNLTVIRYLPHLLTPYAISILSCLCHLRINPVAYMEFTAKYASLFLVNTRNIKATYENWAQLANVLPVVFMWHIIHIVMYPILFHDDVEKKWIPCVVQDVTGLGLSWYSTSYTWGFLLCKSWYGNRHCDANM